MMRKSELFKNEMRLIAMLLIVLMQACGNVEEPFGSSSLGGAGIGNGGLSSIESVYAFKLSWLSDYLTLGGSQNKSQASLQLQVNPGIIFEHFQLGGSVGILNVAVIASSADWRYKTELDLKMAESVLRCPDKVYSVYYENTISFACPKNFRTVVSPSRLPVSRHVILIHEKFNEALDQEIWTIEGT